jgi:hypothetical protein
VQLWGAIDRRRARSSDCFPRQLDDDVEPMGAVTQATPTPTVSTMTIGPHA